MCNRRTRDLKRSLADLADSFGVRLDNISHTNEGHWRATFTAGAVTAIVILPGTPSDWRALRNNAAFIKRRLRSAVTA